MYDTSSVNTFIKETLKNKVYMIAAKLLIESSLYFNTTSFEI